MIKKWERLPENLQIEEVKEYYSYIAKRKCSLFFKRLFDVVVSFFMLAILFPVFLVLAIAIKIDSHGPVFYRQVRVTKYGKHFRIFKFRTMVVDADKGSLVTVNNDDRVTKVGKFIRKCRLDELPQLLDVFRGTMTFVGTRPEVPKYVEKYTPEMLATLLMPAGITSLASIKFKDEATLLDGVEDTDKVYIEKVLPQKMEYNLKALKKFSFFGDIKLMFLTVFAVFSRSEKAQDKTQQDGDLKGVLDGETNSESVIKADQETSENNANLDKSEQNKRE